MTRLGNRGAFAHIEVEVEPVSMRSDAEIGAEMKYWLPMVKAGIQYVCHKFLSKLDGYHVRVTKVDANDMDTSPLVMFYCAAEAVLNALGEPVENYMELDREHRRISFAV